jgi:hypothetical protein
VVTVLQLPCLDFFSSIFVPNSLPAIIFPIYREEEEKEEKEVIHDNI